MKKLFLLAMAFVVVTAFTGCSKDDDAPEINPELIVGKWQFTRDVGYDIIDGEKNEWDDNLTQENEFFTFNADGTGVYVCGTNPPANLAYIISGHTLKLTWNGTWDETYTIKQLTPQKMQLYLYEKTTDPDNTFTESARTYFFIRK